VALEPEFWAALTRIAARRGGTLSALVVAADSGRAPLQPLASALRVLALRAFDPEVQDGPAAQDGGSETATGA
jgi:predicted DNA-binding ribbon-helix-helix protein